MTVKITPHIKYLLFTTMVVLFVSTIHFAVVPNLHLLDKQLLPPVVRSVLIILLLISLFAVLTYVIIYRPITPGKSTWEQGTLTKPLIIEKSGKGILRFTIFLLKILLFSIVLYAVEFYTINLYITNIPTILDGTYVHDKTEVAFMGAPIIAIVMLLIFSCVKLYDNNK